MNTANFWSANRLTIKGCIVGFLILAMLIPTLFIMELISERAQRQAEVKTEVSSKWAGAQTISGPLLVIPYLETTKNNEGKIIVAKKYAYFLPERLTINGELLPEIRHRSIFNIVVYSTDIKMEGEFVPLQPESLGIKREDMQLNESYICFGLSDFRGIENQMSIRWNDSSYVFNAGVPDNNIISNGLNATVALTNGDMDRSSCIPICLNSLFICNATHWRKY